MTAYKLVTIQFKWWGLQDRVENFIHSTEKRIFTNFHRQVRQWEIAGLRILLGRKIMKQTCLVYMIFIYMLVAAISSLTFCKSFEILQKLKVEIYGNFVHNLILHITHFDTISISRVSSPRKINTVASLWCILFVLIIYSLLLLGPGVLLDGQVARPHHERHQGPGGPDQARTGRGEGEGEDNNLFLPPVGTLCC